MADQQQESPENNHHHPYHEQGPPPLVHAIAEVKSEPSSPGSSDYGGATSGSSRPPSLRHNGVNGTMHSEEDSMGLSEQENNAEAPLDFSMRGRSDREGTNGDLNCKREVSPPRSPHATGNCEATQEDSQWLVNGVSSPQSREAGEIQVAGDTRIGEPKTALPGMIPGTTVPISGAQGLLPAGFPTAMLSGGAAAAAGAAASLLGTLPYMVDPTLNNLSSGGTGGGKSTRPFKAYPKDPLALPLGYYGIPNLPGMASMPQLDMATAQALSQSSEEMFKQYREYVLKMQEQLRQQRGGKQNGRVNSRRSSESSGSSSPASATNGNVLSATSPPVNPVQTSTASSPQSSRKRGRTLPDEQKDEAYWERRRKNNDAAKRSRDSRRAKEDEIAIRAAFLEQENLKLRVELAALKNETAKLRCMLYNS